MFKDSCWKETICLNDAKLIDISLHISLHRELPKNSSRKDVWRTYGTSVTLPLVQLACNHIYSDASLVGSNSICSQGQTTHYVKCTIAPSMPGCCWLNLSHGEIRIRGLHCAERVIFLYPFAKIPMKITLPPLLLQYGFPPMPNSNLISIYLFT